MQKGSREARRIQLLFCFFSSFFFLFWKNIARRLLRNFLSQFQDFISLFLSYNHSFSPFLARPAREFESLDSLSLFCLAARNISFLSFLSFPFSNFLS